MVTALHLLLSFSNVMHFLGEEDITVMSNVQAVRAMLQVKQPQEETRGGLNGWQICPVLWCVRIDFDAAFPPDLLLAVLYCYITITWNIFVFHSLI